MLSHRMTKSTEYRIWSTMWQRCTNQKHDAYPYYGGRGISVCERWKSFENFFADVGPRPRGLTLDRIDGNANYEPGNCRWATFSEQMRNRRSTIFVSHESESLCLSDWERKLGFNPGTLRLRFSRGDRPPYLFRSEVRGRPTVVFSAELMADIRSNMASYKVSKKHGISASYVRGIRNGSTPLKAEPLPSSEPMRQPVI